MPTIHESFALIGICFSFLLLLHWTGVTKKLYLASGELLPFLLSIIMFGDPISYSDARMARIVSRLKAAESNPSELFDDISEISQRIETSKGLLHRQEKVQELDLDFMASIFDLFSLMAQTSPQRIKAVSKKRDILHRSFAQLREYYLVDCDSEKFYKALSKILLISKFSEDKVAFEADFATRNEFCSQVEIIARSRNDNFPEKTMIFLKNWNERIVEIQDADVSFSIILLNWWSDRFRKELPVLSSFAESRIEKCKCELPRLTDALMQDNDSEILDSLVSVDRSLEDPIERELHIQIPCWQTIRHLERKPITSRLPPYNHLRIR